MQLRGIDPGSGYRGARELLAVQRAAYAVEAALLDDEHPGSRGAPGRAMTPLRRG